MSKITTIRVHEEIKKKLEWSKNCFVLILNWIVVFFLISINTGRALRSCGNNVCDVGETVENCPSDCSSSFIIDNSDSEFFTIGDWPVSTYSSGYYGSNYQHHSAGTGDNKATWKLSKAMSKSYHVYARWTSHPNRASNALYNVNHADGSTTVRVDQRENGGEWNYLGTYNLNSDSSIVLTDDADGYVIADAIFVLVENMSVFYVSPTGNDNNPGTEAQPFGTIGKAKEVVRAAIKPGMNSDINIVIRGGKYFLSSSLSFDEGDSGKDKYKVIYKNYPGEEPVIIGGQRITNWEPHSASIYRAYVGKDWRFYTLFENGERAIMARTPNTGYFRVAESVSSAKKYTQFIYDSNDIPNTFDYSDAQIYIWPGIIGSSNMDYAPDILPIVGIDWSSRIITLRNDTIRTIRLEIRHGATRPIEKGNRYFVQGSLDFLDTPGEFYLDTSEGYLYYWPKNTPINEQEIIAPTTKRVVELKGSSRLDPVHDIEFEGLTFSVSDFSDAACGYFPVENYSAIYMENAVDISVKSSNILNVGSSGIILKGYAQNNTIQGNLIENIGVHGVWLHGFPPGDEDVNKNNVVSDNYIRNGGQLHGYGSGIVLHYSGSNEISHNKIVSMPKVGISLIGLTFDEMEPSYNGVDVVPYKNHWDFIHTRNNSVEFNDISHVLLDTQDGGGINTWGTGRYNTINNNRIHDIESGIPGGLTMGLYLDDMSDYFTVTNNVIHDIKGDKSRPVYMKGIRNNFINNVIVNYASDQAMIFWAMGQGRNDHLTLTRNIFYNAPKIFRFVDWTDDKVTESNNNIFYNPADSYYITVVNTDVTLNEWRINYGFDQDSIVKDPLFVDYESKNFTLQEDSPAFDLGFKQIDISNIGPRVECFDDEDCLETEECIQRECKEIGEICNNNGICEEGETVDNCPGDCIISTTTTPTSTTTTRTTTTTISTTTQTTTTTLPCQLTNAYWSQSSAVEGETVQLTVEGTNCDGKTVTLNYWEEDKSESSMTGSFLKSLTGRFLEGNFFKSLFGIGVEVETENDPINPDDYNLPKTMTFDGNIARATWQAVWFEDSDGKDKDPEIFFEASLDDQLITSGVLRVNKKITTYPITINDVQILDSNHNSVNLIQSGQQYYVKATIENVGTEAKNPMLVIQVKNSKGEVLGHISSLKSNIAVGKINYLEVGYLADKADDYIAEVFVWSDWPSLGGEPLSSPSSKTFMVSE